MPSPKLVPLVLACAEESGVALLTRVAAVTGVSREMVRKWRVRFMEGRLAALADAPRPGAPRPGAPRPGAPRKITDEQVEVVVPRAEREGPRSGQSLVDPCHGGRDQALALAR